MAGCPAGRVWAFLCAASLTRAQFIGRTSYDPGEFAVQEYADGVIPINSGQLYEKMVNPFQWTWFAISLVSIDPANETVYHNVLLELDSMDIIPLPGSNGIPIAWATFDVMLVNESLPANAQTEEVGPVEMGSPTCWFNEVCPGGYFARYFQKSRVTSSFGYNTSSPGGQVLPMRTVYVGVREAGISSQSVRYRLRVTALPRVVKDGMSLVTALPACVGSPPNEEELDFCKQYFVVDVGPFDVFSATLIRGGRTAAGSNLTMVSATGDEVSTGEGFVGSLFLGDPDHFLEAPPLRNMQHLHVTNLTARGEVGVYCTLEKHQGLYTVAIVADNSYDRGFAQEESLYRPGRGRFNLSFYHAQYKDGALQMQYQDNDRVGATVSEMRGGCVGFGQLRNYSVSSEGVADSNLYALIDGGNVSFIRARCSGCEWVEARHPVHAVSASPCDLRNGTTWEVQVGLDDYTTATLAGLRPAEFTLHTSLQNATAYDGHLVLPAAEGGDGYVCCGAIKSWLLPDVPQRLAPALQLNVTAGHVRSVYIKHQSCPEPASDLDGAQCVGECQMAWLTVYDAFYGSAEHTQSLGSLAAPFQIPWGTSKWTTAYDTTKRRDGDYYVAVHALDGQAAEFEIAFFLLDPGPAPPVFDCSRFVGFCPKDAYSVGYRNALDPAERVPSAASPRGPGSSHAALLFAASAAVALARRRLLGDPRSMRFWPRS